MGRMIGMSEINICLIKIWPVGSKGTCIIDNSRPGEGEELVRIFWKKNDPNRDEPKVKASGLRRITMAHLPALFSRGNNGQKTDAGMRRETRANAFR